MQIQWLGLASFRIQTTHSVIITDPYQDNTGLIMPKMKATIVLVSDKNNTVSSNIKRISGDPFVVQAPGEYEIGSTFIYGIPSSVNIYVIEDEHMRIGFLGSLDSELTTKQMEILEGSDILLLPVGTLNKVQRTSLISQIEPRIIVPYLYKQPKVKKDLFQPELEELDIFLKEMGVKDLTANDKLTLKRKDLPQEETTVQLLKAQTS